MTETSWIDTIQPPHATVTGQYVAISHDSADPNLTPDVQPLNGQILLTPTVTAGRIEDVLAQIRPVTVRVFGGQIVDDEDAPGARVLATDVDLGVQDWAWTATFEFDGGLKLRPVTFKAPAGTTVNLTSGIIPVSSAPYQIVQGEPGESAYDVARRLGYVGTEQEWLDSLQGESGASTWDAITEKPTLFPPDAHTHDDRYQRGTRGTIPSGADLFTYRGSAFAGAWTISDATDHTLIGLPPGYAGAGFMDLVWSHDWAQVQTVTEGTTTRQWVRSLWPNNASPWRRTDERTKTVAVPLTAGDGGGSSVAGADIAYRLPLNFGAPIERFRLRLRNLDYRDSQGRTGVITLHSVSVGEAARDASGMMTGAVLDGTVQTLPLAGTATDAAELVTGWANVNLDLAKSYLMTYRMTGVAGQAWSTDIGGGWQVTDPAAAHSPAAGVTLVGMVPLAVSLDIETPSTTPVYGALGDSLTAGSGSALPVHDSWIAVYARTHRGLYTMWAAHGDTMASWATTAGKTWRFADQARPDVIFVAMGSNDIWGGADLATLQGRLHAMMTRMRQFTSTNIVLCSIWPRDSTADEASENVRRAYNSWMRTTLPGGASRYVDTWPAVSADNSTLRTEYDADGIHLNTAGYAAVASALDGGLPGTGGQVESADLTPAGITTGGSIKIQKVGPIVTLSLASWSTTASGTISITLPAWAAAPAWVYGETVPYYSSDDRRTIRVINGVDMTIIGVTSGDALNATVNWGA